MVKTVLATLLSSCRVRRLKEEFAAQQRDAQQNLKTTRRRARRSAALEKRSLISRRRTLLAVAAREAHRHLGQAPAGKGALEAKSAQYQQLAAHWKADQERPGGESRAEGQNDGQAQGQGPLSSGSSSLNREGKRGVGCPWRTPSRTCRARTWWWPATPTTCRQRQVRYTDQLDLSTARAVNVLRYLQDERSLPGDARAAGFSEYRPLVPNDSPANRVEKTAGGRDRPHRRRLPSVVDARR